jgi:hypothetical protein
MKWVLRAVGTSYFVKEDGSFTERIDDAYDLPSIKAGLDICRKRSLIGMELVLRLGSSVEASIKMGDVC